ncbi:MAG: ribosome silencing factor [Brevinematales bacterium]|nr:ribosome silencing factor [Brevinematales bacterium]
MKKRRLVSKKFINKICKVISSKKAEEITVIDTSKLTSEFDYIILANASNKYHIQSIVEEINRFIEKENVPVLARDLSFESGWVVIDLYHTIIHIMTPEVRKYYSLERLWEIPV